MPLQITSDEPAIEGQRLRAYGTLSANLRPPSRCGDLKPRGSFMDVSLTPAMVVPGNFEIPTPGL